MKRALLIRRTAISRLERYEVESTGTTTLLDALEAIRVGSAPDLMYRHSCHHGSCGTCAMRVNGKEVLACLTSLDSLYDSASGEEHPPIVEPLRAFDSVGDLAVDPGSLFRSLPEGATHLRASDAKRKAERPAGIDRYERFEDCIECGCCVSACPVIAEERKDFIGPAALAALHRETINHPDRKSELLVRAAKEDGVAACERHIDCSRVCPRAVYPAKHIELIRRDLASRKEMDES